VLPRRYADHRPISEIIIDLCAVPRLREEIAAALGIDSQYYLVRKYLKPLLKSGKLQMTLPDKPQSKFQRYISK
jgi:ATP-dependent DNA helicase RecG